MNNIQFIELRKLAKIEASGVDKKINENEILVKLCNFTDVYYNWAITKNMVTSLMDGSVNSNEMLKFQLKKGQVAITKDSETREDIGIPVYIADDLENVVLGYHCTLITPNENLLDGKYLNVYLNSYLAKKYFSNQASGSGQRYTLTSEAIGNVKIPLISLKEQKKIGSLFSTIDKKIETNKNINDNLSFYSMVI